ncbi:hypothetical protein Tco_1490379 [Tanacetum coccineum]
MDEVCSICCVKAGNSFVNDPNSNSFNDSPNFFNHPPQPQMKKQEERIIAEEQAGKVSSQYWKPPIYYDDDDDDEESYIPLRDIISELPLSVAIAPVLPTKEPDDSLSMGDEHLSTIPKTESDKGNDSNHFDAESDLLESLLNRDTSIVILLRLTLFLWSSLSPILLLPPGDILFLEELLNDEIRRDLPPIELKDDEPSTTKSLIEKPLDIDKEIYDFEGDILFFENLLKDEPSKADKSEIYTLIGELPDTFLMEDEEIEFNPFKDIDDSVPIPRVSVTPLDSLDLFFDSYDTSYTNPSELYSEYTLNYDNQLFNIQNNHSDEPEIDTKMDEVHSTVQIPHLFEELTSDKSMQDIILHRIHHGMVNSSRLSFYLDLFSPKDNFGSLSSDTFELGDQNIVFDPGIFFINGVFSFARKSPHLMINNFMFDKCHILREISLMIESLVSFYPKDKEIRGESS